ncbi:MAG: lamin tail domain-containing protein, partial [Anaerolineae bacterium]
MNPSKRRLCSVVHVVVCLGLMGGAVWSADFASPLKAQLPQEETTATTTSPVTPTPPEEGGVLPTDEATTSSAEEETSPVEADTPVPSEESTAPTPYEAPPDALSPVETPPAQGVPDTAVVETPTKPGESTPAPVDATPTNDHTPTAIPEAPLTHETPIAEETDTAPPAEDTLAPPGDMPATQEIPDASIVIEAPATPEHDLPSTPSSSLTSTLAITLPPDSSLTGQTMPGAVVINEIGWAGTVADITAQWIELYNTTSEPIWLTNWRLSTADGRWVIDLAGIIAAQGYFLLECNNDLTVRDVPADNIYVGALSPEGETLHLLDASGALIDTANGDGGPWPAGDRTARRSMERLSPQAPDLDENWVTHNGLVRNGEDVLGNPINGTPRQRNASTYPPPSVMPGEVVINEVAWSGTQADSRAEWIELANTTERAIDVGGWQLKTADGGLMVVLHGVIAPRGFFLLEREDDLAMADIPADQVANFGDGLDDAGEVLQLLIGTLRIDTANGDGGPWPGGSGVPAAHSMERIAPHLPDEDTSWASHDGLHHIARDMAGNPINGTPRAANSTMLLPALRISEFLYAGTTPTTQGDEFVELCNAQPVEATLYHIKIGDAAQAGKGESMWELPSGVKLSPDACLVIAKNAAQFAARFGFLPEFELITGSAAYPDTPAVPDLAPYTAWAGRAWALDDSGDEVVLLGPDDQIVDSVAYLRGDYAAAGLAPDAVRAPPPYSLQRLWPLDSDLMPADFTRALPSPGRVTAMPQPPAIAPPTVDLPGGMHAYWGVLNHPSSYSDGNAPPALGFAAARAAGLHFLAITDDAAALNPRLWSDCQQRGARASQTGAFVALCGFEYRALPQGFASIWNTSDYFAPPAASGDAVIALDAWLKTQPQALASLHRAPLVTPLSDLPDPPATASRFHLWQVFGSPLSTGGVDPLETTWMQMLASGWQLAPLPDEASASGDAADFDSRRVGVVAPQLTSDDLLAALRARRVFATQDNRLALTLRSGDWWMGSTLSKPEELVFEIEVADVGTVTQPITLTFFDRSTPLATRAFPSSNASWSLPATTQPGHYYWVRAIQADGDVASSAPIWIAGMAAADTVFINEILPAPRQVDWNGDGTPDRKDEWIELHNPGETPVGLG